MYLTDEQLGKVMQGEWKLGHLDGIASCLNMVVTMTREDGITIDDATKVILQMVAHQREICKEQYPEQWKGHQDAKRANYPTWFEDYRKG